MSAPTETPEDGTPAGVRLTLHAIDLERALTEEDYATNSEALQECMRAWKLARAASGRRGWSALIKALDPHIKVDAFICEGDEDSYP
jgi:hypothetical protein